MNRRETKTVEVFGQPITFEAWPEQGAWYQVGHDPAGDETGFLYAPMLADGSFDPEEVGEVEDSYRNAIGEA